MARAKPTIRLYQNYSGLSFKAHFEKNVGEVLMWNILKEWNKSMKRDKKWVLSKILALARDPLQFKIAVHHLIYLLFHTFVLKYFIYVLPLLVLYSLKLPYILCLVFIIDSKKVMLSRQGTKSYFSNKKNIFYVPITFF